MVRSDTKSGITLRYPCVPASRLGPENVMIYGVECCVDAVLASVSCLDRPRKSKSNIGQYIQ